MLCLASTGQVFADNHLEKVEGRVQTVLVQLQLTTQLLDLTLSWKDRYLCWTELRTITRTDPDSEKKKRIFCCLWLYLVHETRWSHSATDFNNLYRKTQDVYTSLDKKKLVPRRFSKFRLREELETYYLIGVRTSAWDAVCYAALRTGKPMSLWFSRFMSQWVWCWVS